MFKILQLAAIAIAGYTAIVLLAGWSFWPMVIYWAVIGLWFTGRILVYGAPARGGRRHAQHTR